MPLEVEILPTPFLMSLCFRGNCLRRSRGRVPGRTGRDEGQATVEAAFILPVLLLCLGLLLQPACLLYTRAVMQAAAAEGCEVMAVRPASVGTSDLANRAYVLRRLKAVPEVPLFHQGGSQGWHIEMEGGGASGTARVRIETTARPLPLLGLLPALLGQLDGEGNVRLSVEVEVATRPEWVEGSYESWSSAW